MGLELNVAQEIQSTILPRPGELNLLHSLDVSATMSPATEVGGDYYDFLVSDDRTTATIAIADVTGHGLESGILAVRIIHNIDNIPIEELLNILNKTLFDNAKRMGSDKCLTFLLLKYSQGIVRIYGQHEEVILVTHNGEINIIDTFNLGFPLGLDRDISHYLGCKEIVLNPGDSLILYTDGVTEATDKFNEVYGTDRLHQVIKKNYYRSAEEIKQSIIYDLMEFIGATNIYDDITLMVVKQK